jgi:hypothetical protein
MVDLDQIGFDMAVDLTQSPTGLFLSDTTYEVEIGLGL